MSVTRGPSRARHFCGHPRCSRLSWVSTGAYATAYGSFATWSATGTQAGLWCSLAAAGLLAGAVLGRWPHPRAGAPGIEALADATREQRFPSLDGHFQEWAKELGR